MDRFRFVLFVFAESYRDFFSVLLVLVSISVLKLVDGDFNYRLIPT